MITSLPVIMGSAYPLNMNVITRMIAMMEVTNQDAVRTFPFSFFFNLFFSLYQTVNFLFYPQNFYIITLACKPNPCGSKACVVEAHGKHRCVCHEGFIGLNCNISK